MATIRKRRGRYHVQIRKNDYPVITQIFTSITSAKKWIKAAVSDMERRLFQPVSDTTVGEILARYQRTILPKHRGASRHESYRIKRLQAAFGHQSVSDLKASDIAHYRDKSLEAGEEQRLLLSANDQLRRIIILALETGLRRSEILNTKKSDINHSKSVVLIPSTKADVPRTIPPTTHTQVLL